MLRRTKLSMSLLVAFGGALASTVVQAQQQLERVEITGSSIRRIEAEGALPVTVIKVEELTRLGVTTAEQAMQRIAANQSNFGVNAGVGGVTGGKSEADLRGLSGPTATNANKTLVLLNGRRLANHAFDAAAVDLNAIPLAAVERIEVLRDSASTTYGTDAIGGVINFILRRDYKGLELSAERQLPREDGGGDTKRFGATAGWGNLAEDRFNIMGTIDYRKQSTLRSVDRDFAKTGILNGDVVSGTSGTSFPGDVGGFEPSLPGCNPPSSIPAPDGASCRYDFTRQVDAIPENEQVTGLVRGSFAITPEHTASLEYVYARNKTNNIQVAPDPSSHLIPRSSPFWPANAPASIIEDIPDINSSDPNATVPGGVVNWRTEPAGNRTSHDRTVTDRLLFELKGVLADWDYKTGLGTTKNRSKSYVDGGYTNDTLMQQGVFDGIINPFGPQTAAGQAAIDAANPKALVVTGENKVDFADFSVTRELFSVPAGTVAVAFGVEYRRERSDFVNTDITGELPTLGVDPDGDTSGRRNVKAVFGELNIPLIAKKLDMTLAARFDEYSDFGSTVNPKISARYTPIKELLFRASAATGFRAPTLYEIFQPRALTFTSDNYDDPVLCPGGVAVPGASAGVVCGQQVLQRLAGPAALGKPVDSLDPEESKTYTIGFVIEPVPSLTFGVDFWNIEVDNLISPLPEQAVFGDPTKYASRFVRCSQTTAEIRAQVDACLNTRFDPIAFIDVPTENLGTLKTNGIDLNVSWRSGPTAIGNFGVVFDGTYVNRYKYQRERGGDFINANGRYSDSAPVFRWQHVITTNWSYGSWGATLGNRFKSDYQDQDPAFDVSSYTVWDGSVAWTGVKNLTLLAGVNNMFDKDPPQTVQVTTFQRGYDPRFTDALGRTLLFRASYKFF